MAGCVGGMCVLASCNPGFRNCDGMAPNGCEINGNVDTNNCGNCGLACAQLPHAVAGCMNAACVVASCAMGYGNCDKADHNGCETDLTANMSHCGACGKVCPAPANVVASCTAGMCVQGGCVQDYTDCDNNMNNGCEARLATDPKNCGVCGKVCMGAGAPNTSVACVNGACSFACNAGFADCDANEM